jgi:epoxyqueuosine reductase
MVRNAAIAAGNSRQPALIPQLQALSADPDPVVAEAAAWAVARLSGTAPAR